MQINEPGTEYAVAYNSVPILGDGEGGFVEIKVENTTDDEGITTPGQITEVKVTSPERDIQPHLLIFRRLMVFLDLD